VTSNCSSIPETVGDAAIKVDPNNPGELAHAIKRVLNDNKLQKQLIDKGLRHVQLHTWENAATKMMEVFKAVHKRGPWKKRRK
jgi:glycosyltransferase involved in cell wall biosynthesis